MRPKLSAIIVTRNEEKKIRRCLESLRWVDEIVVVDQSSTDDTAKICREYTGKVLIVPAKGYCEPDRLIAAAQADHDWILYVDADEEVPAQLREEIITTLASGAQYNCYFIARRNIFLGKWVKGSGWYPSYVLRLFRKAYVRFSEDIHTDVMPLAECGRLECSLLHYTCEALREYFAKTNRYSSILARQAYQKGMRVNTFNYPLRILGMPLAYFFYKFVYKRGYRDGWRGLFIAFLTFLTIFFMNAKLWEIGRKKAAGETEHYYV